jgi:hypothetical protein
MLDTNGEGKTQRTARVHSNDIPFKYSSLLFQAVASLDQLIYLNDVIATLFPSCTFKSALKNLGHLITFSAYSDGSSW